MRKLKQYWGFWVPYLVFIVALATMIAVNEKADLHLWFNTVHTSVWDVFFRYYTLVGEWVSFVVMAGLLFYRYKAALLVFASQLTSGLVTFILKRIFDAPRPKRYFAEFFPDVELAQVMGVHMHSSHSFPSGHTTSAFALFLSLAFLTKRKELQFLYCILAVLVGYSRIYLSQHFATDVLAGSIVGVVMTTLCLYLLDRKSPDWYNNSLLKKG